MQATQSVDIESYASLFEACGGTDALYLRLHFPRYLETQSRFLSHWEQDRRGALLDVGAHWLHQSLLYALNGFEVTALDVPTTFEDPHVRALAHTHRIRLLPEPSPESAHALTALASDTFDVVLFTEIIEHITFNPIAMWREIHRVLKPGGHLVLTTPNYYALRGRAWHWRRFLIGRGSGVEVDNLLSQPTFAHHWKEYSLRELTHYFRTLSPDFAFVASDHVHKHEQSTRHRYIDATARVIEHLVPTLRPNLYLQMQLASKDAGIVIEPRW
jgi:2-polyprenyl-3-methyl-5-hydroxy-6-metoxy-1,4-benzoquinol methylase